MSEEEGQVEENYIVEKILARRTLKTGVKEYRIKWKDWGAQHNSWEPEGNILDPSLIQHYEESLRKGKKGGKKGKKPGKKPGKKATDNNQQSNIVTTTSGKKNKTKRPLEDDDDEDDDDNIEVIDEDLQLIGRQDVNANDSANVDGSTDEEDQKTEDSAFSSRKEEVNYDDYIPKVKKAKWRYLSASEWMPTNLANYHHHHGLNINNNNNNNNNNPSINNSRESGVEDEDESDVRSNSSSGSATNKTNDSGLNGIVRRRSDIPEIMITDVTTNELTVTVRESRSPHGFFRNRTDMKSIAVSTTDAMVG